MSDYTKVTLEIDLGGKRLNIGCEDDKGSGHGHRLTGPKYSMVPQSTVHRHELNAEDVRELENYCRIWHEINDEVKP